MKKNYLLLSLICVSCAVGPNFKKPTTILDQKKIGFEKADSGQGADVFEWWKLFSDETLQKLLKEVETFSLDIKQATLRIAEYKALYQISGGSLGPSVSLDTSMTRNQLSKNTPLGQAISRSGGSITNTQYQIGPSLSWEIDLFGGLRRDREAAIAEFSSQIEQYRGIYIQVLSALSKAYIELREVQMRLNIAQKNVESQSTAYQLANARFKAGIVSELDTRRAKVLLSNSQSQIPLLQIAESQAIHKISMLLGKEPQFYRDLLSVKKDLPALPDKISLGMQSDLLMRRPDIRRAEAELHAQTARVGLAKADYFPRFTLSASVGLQSVTAGNLFESASTIWSLGPAIRWPLFQMGRIRARVAAQNKRAEWAAVAYEKAILHALEDTENALVSYSLLKTRLENMNEAVVNATRAVEVSQDRYNAGLASFLEVIDAQRDLFSAEDLYVQNASDIRLALIQVYEAVGGGWQTSAYRE